MGTYNAVADAWKGQLNFHRLCTYARPHDRCWLIEDLAAWNCVLRGFSYELVEVCPGKLSLRYVPHDAAPVQTTNARLERDFLVSWLLEHHRCIDELRVLCIDSAPEQPERQGNDLSVRSLEVTVPKACADVCYLPAYIYVLRGVEKLRMSTWGAINQSVLLRMLRCNCNSLRTVEIIESQLSRRMMRALQRLCKCESLKVSVRPDRYDRGTAKAAMTRLVRHRVRPESIGLERNVPIIVEAVKTNATLTTLDLELFVNDNSLKELFAALEVNATLKKLRIGFTFIAPSCGEALALALSKNASLLDLELAGHVDYQCMINVAEALTQNTTLEKLNFSCVVEGVDGVLALCDALRSNTTLKKLVFAAFSASHTERAALAAKLAYGGCYSRVMLPLAEPDLPPLSTLLTCPISCPEELGQINTSDTSEANVKLLFDAIASSSRVRKLSIVIDAHSEAKLGALCTMLKANQSVRTVKITLLSVQQQCLQEVLNALEANKTISELSVTSFVLEAKSASSLLHFLAHNRTITTFKLSLIGIGLSRVIETLSRGIVINPVILEFQTDGSTADARTRDLISETLSRNRAALNRAVDFVVLRCKDRRCAEAFELFSGKPCLLAQVIKTSGQTEHEAQLAIASAEKFLLDNYLIITGIVRLSVVCHTGYGRTQCDQLNSDCWSAILRHLKISDVL